MSSSSTGAWAQSKQWHPDSDLAAIDRSEVRVTRGRLEGTISAHNVNQRGKLEVNERITTYDLLNALSIFGTKCFWVSTRVDYPRLEPEIGLWFGCTRMSIVRLAQ